MSTNAPLSHAHTAYPRPLARKHDTNTKRNRNRNRFPDRGSPASISSPRFLFFQKCVRFNRIYLCFNDLRTSKIYQDSTIDFFRFYSRRSKLKIVLDHSEQILFNQRFKNVAQELLHFVGQKGTRQPFEPEMPRGKSRTHHHAALAANDLRSWRGLL